MTFVDPIDPPEASERMTAAALKNKICLIRPMSWDEWPSTPAEYDGEGNQTKKAQGPRPYCECDVWVLDRAGIVEEGTGVRFSWWKLVKPLDSKGEQGQLRPVELGSFLLAMPVEQPDRSVILVKTAKEEWRKIAREAAATVGLGATVVTSSEELDGTEVF